MFIVIVGIIVEMIGSSKWTSTDDDVGNNEPMLGVGIGTLIFIILVCIGDFIISVSIQSCLFPLVKYLSSLQVIIVWLAFKLARAIDAN